MKQHLAYPPRSAAEPAREPFGASVAPAELEREIAVLAFLLGGETSIGGNSSGEADCCARAAVGPRKIIGRQDVVVSRQAQRRLESKLERDMVRPRADVNGTSQRTRFHDGAQWAPVKLMSVLPDRHLRV